MNLEHLARDLADRLQEVVPDGFIVRAEGGMLWYSAEEGRFPGQGNTYEVGTTGTYFVDHLQLDPSDPFEERLLEVTRRALDELQDFVDEAMHEPWPGRRPPPRPHSELRDGELRCWYEDEGNVVVVALRPIPYGDEGRR